MKSSVYFIDFGSRGRDLIYERVKRLIKESNIADLFTKGEIVAVKLHFGEDSPFFIPPVYVREIVEYLKPTGAKFFLTDTTSLYAGMRREAPSHIMRAIQNGFSSVGLPIIIADGLRGGDYKEVRIDGKYFKHVKVASAIYQADSILLLSHFKGHELTGFGGAIKNLGMGGVAKQDKFSLHSDIHPVISGAMCKICGLCQRWCPESAISLEGYAIIDPETCAGCGICISVCPEHAIGLSWSDDSSLLQKKIVETAVGVVQGKKLACINFLTGITPMCDCNPMQGAPICPDIGFLASTDPVAIDKASFDIVEEKTDKKLSTLRPHIDMEIQIRYGAEMQLGKQEYQLVNLSSYQCKNG